MQRLLLVRLAAIILSTASVGALSCTKSKDEKTIACAWSIQSSERYIYGEHAGLAALDGVIYFLAASAPFQCDQVAALNAIEIRTGATLWKRLIETQCLKGRRNPLVAIGDGVLCYKNRSGLLCALDAKTGVDRWQAQNISAILGISNGALHALNLNGRYTVLEASNGTIRTLTDIRGNELSDLLFADGVRYLFNNRRLSATDERSGKLLWSYDAEDEVAFGMRAADGIVYAAEDGRVTALDGKTGGVLWDLPPLGVLPVLDQGVAYLGSEEKDGTHTILKLNPRSGVIEGTISGPLWYGYEPVVAEGIIYSPVKRPHYANFELAKRMYDVDQSASADYAVMATDASSGRSLWTTEFVWGQYCTKPIVVGDFVVFGIAGRDWLDSAEIYAFRRH